MMVDRATVRDIGAVVEHLTAQLREHEIDTPASAVVTAVKGAIVHPERAVIFCARDNSESDRAAIVGVAYLSFVWALEHGGFSAWLEELYVVPSHRARGVGQLLLRAAAAHARDAGCAAIDLEVTPAHTRATHLYAREGFVPHDRARWILRLRDSFDPHD